MNLSIGKLFINGVKSVLKTGPSKNELITEIAELKMSLAATTDELVKANSQLAEKQATKVVQKSHIEEAKSNWEKIKGLIDCVTSPEIKAAKQRVIEGTHSAEDLALLKKDSQNLIKYWTSVTKNPRLFPHAHLHQMKTNVSVPYSGVENDALKYLPKEAKALEGKDVSLMTPQQKSIRENGMKKAAETKKLFESIYNPNTYTKLRNDFINSYYHTPGFENRIKADQLVIDRFENIQNSLH